MIEGRPGDSRGFIHKKLLGAAKGFAGTFLSGGNPFVGAAQGFIAGGSSPATRPQAPPIAFVPNIVGRAPDPRTITPGQFGSQVINEITASGPSQTIIYNADGTLKKKRRRMNVANPKALRRAIRREAGFVTLAKRALKGTAYQITRKGSGRSRGPKVIVESGPGSVVTR